MGEIQQQNFERMLETMRHRGPDDQGSFIRKGISLGMVRLSIIDLSKNGHQPMSNEAGSVWIVYNGELYNFQDERTILENGGYSFRSTSDTEVVLRMYEHYGDDFLCRMRGMFALAIYDMRPGVGKERLILARDPLGIKPLLYAHTDSHFVFASEMKSILASGLIRRTFDPEALRHLLTYGAIIQPRTAIEGVKMLLPGRRLILDSGGIKIEQYWSLGVSRISTLQQVPYEDLVDKVRDALTECVRRQMISDVPIGAFLSGGVDSSLLVALMAKCSGHQIKTFSVGFEREGARIDETDDAARIARYIGTDHTRVIVTGKDVRERIKHIVASLDQPSVDGVNSYFVSLAASREVTVAISGTGGDELFGGYPWFIEMTRQKDWDRQHPLFTSMKHFYGSLAQNPWFDTLIQSWLGVPLDQVRKRRGFLSRYTRCNMVLGPHRAACLLAPQIRGSACIGLEPSCDLAPADELPDEPPIPRVSALCLRGYTQNQLLRDIDAVSMAHSLEVRVPFLDPVLVDIALSLPDDTKLGECSKIADPNGATYQCTGAKRILIDVGRDILPEGMDKQKKRGFGMPFESWLKGPLREILEETLSDEAIRSRGFFDPEYVDRMKRDFFKGNGGWTGPWLLMIIELWCREILDKRPEDMEMFKPE